jgi:hypothetical protein
MPTNNELNGLDKELTGEADGKRVNELLDVWENRHNFRYAAFGLTAICSLGAMYFERPF